MTMQAALETAYNEWNKEKSGTQSADEVQNNEVETRVEKSIKFQQCRQSTSMHFVQNHKNKSDEISTNSNDEEMVHNKVCFLIT